MFKRAYHIALVPMFFAVSGFLVTSSAYRLRNVRIFLAFRLLRIIPALAMEVTLSALVLGPMFTTLTLAAYFSHPQFFEYFRNIVGIVTMLLPGVFTSNPIGPVTNVNLWTLPAEFYCYLVTAAAMATSLFFNRKVFSYLFALMTLCLIYASFDHDVGVTVSDIYGTEVALYYFFCGVFAFLWRGQIPVDWKLFVFCCLAGGGLLGLRKAVFLAPLFVTYATVFVGLMNIPKIPLLSRGDYSYGVYLYGFPICQALICAFPQFTGHHNLLALTGGLVTLIFAALSWHLVEMKFLLLKPYFKPKVNRVPSQAA